MRRCYLVCYDIADDRRLKKVHKTLTGYGEPWQYSVFHCFLKDIDRVRLENTLSEIIHHREDQVLIIDLGTNDPTERQAMKTLGIPLPPPPTGVLVL